MKNKLKNWKKLLNKDKMIVNNSTIAFYGNWNKNTSFPQVRQ